MNIRFTVRREDILWLFILIALTPFYGLAWWASIMWMAFALWTAISMGRHGQR